MKFQIEKREKKSLPTGFPEENFRIASVFAKKVYEEFGDFAKGVILFGSVVQNKTTSHDIDILIILDDVRVNFTKEIVQGYRLIISKLVADVDKDKLHV